MSYLTGMLITVLLMGFGALINETGLMIFSLCLMLFFALKYLISLDRM